MSAMRFEYCHMLLGMGGSKLLGGTLALRGVILFRSKTSNFHSFLLFRFCFIGGWGPCEEGSELDDKEKGAIQSNI